MDTPLSTITNSLLPGNIISDVNLNSYIRNSENNECFGLYYYFLWFFAISLMGILCHLIVNKAPNEQQYPTGFKNEKEWMFIVGGNLVVLLGLPIALQLASELWEFFGLILLLFLLPCRAFMMTGVFTIGSKDEIDWGNTYDCLIMTIFIGYFIIRIIVDISGSPSSRGGLDIALFFIVSFSLIGIVLMPTLIAFDYYSRLALKITLATIMLIISITLINVLFFNDNISNYRLPNTKASSLNMINSKNEKNTINVGAANLRSGPSTQYQILTVIKKGDQFKILSSKNGWSKIDFNGKDGYISNKLIQKVKN